MLSPLVYAKVVCARNAYLKAYRKAHLLILAEKKRHFLDIMDRYDIYMSEEKPNDARRILKLATTKKNATGLERKLLGAIRRDIRGEPLAEPARMALPAAACAPQA